MLKLVNRRFSDWLVLAEAGRSPWRKRLIAVRCVCGYETIAQAQNIVEGKSLRCQSCSKVGRPSNRRTHGEAGKRTKEYSSWKSMNQRCLNPGDKNYPLYGGSGVTVCVRWQGVNGYASFLDDMGRRPSRRHTLDRIDNTKGYSPDNCRWSTPKAQRRNQERYKQFHPSESTLRIALIRAGYSEEDATKALLNLAETLSKSPV